MMSRDAKDAQDLVVGLLGKRELEIKRSGRKVYGSDDPCLNILERTFYAIRRTDA